MKEEDGMDKKTYKEVIPGYEELTTMSVPELVKLKMVLERYGEVLKRMIRDKDST